MQPGVISSAPETAAAVCVTGASDAAACEPALPAHDKSRGAAYGVGWRGRVTAGTWAAVKLGKWLRCTLLSLRQSRLDPKLSCALQLSTSLVPLSCLDGSADAAVTLVGLWDIDIHGVAGDAPYCEAADLLKPDCGLVSGGGDSCVETGLILELADAVVNGE